jgi:hypothetical protein
MCRFTKQSSPRRDEWSTFIKDVGSFSRFLRFFFLGIGEREEKFVKK